jgi:hypothetical protein
MQRTTASGAKQVQQQRRQRRTFDFPLPLPTEANRELDDARRDNSRGAAKPIEIFRRVKGGSLEDCRKSGRFLFVRRPPQRRQKKHNEYRRFHRTFSLVLALGN